METLYAEIIQTSMESIDFFLAGLTVVLSVFLLIINIRAYRKSSIHIFLILMIVFLALLVDGGVTLLVGFSLITIPISLTAFLLISNLLILSLFYFVVARGS